MDFVGICTTSMECAARGLLATICMWLRISAMPQNFGPSPTVNHSRRSNTWCVPWFGTSDIAQGPDGNPCPGCPRRIILPCFKFAHVHTTRRFVKSTPSCPKDPWHDDCGIRDPASEYIGISIRRLTPIGQHVGACNSSGNYSSNNLIHYKNYDVCGEPAKPQRRLHTCVACGHRSPSAGGYKLCLAAAIHPSLKV